MNIPKIQRGVAGFLTLVILAGFSALPGLADGSQYLINVDTGSVSGTSGFLDFQFNPGPDSQPAYATITDFTGGTLGGALDTLDITGSVTGTLPGPVLFINDQALNEYFQTFNFGNSFSLLVSLTGPALDSPDGAFTSGSSFLIGLYDNNQIPILSIDASGAVGEIDINLDGTTSSTSFPASEGSGSVVTFEEQTVPEPSTLLLLVGGMGILFCLGRSRLAHKQRL